MASFFLDRTYSFLRVNCTLLFLACGLHIFGNEPTCFFRPPDNWMAAERSALSPLVKVGFYGPRKQVGFCPSINLAEEVVHCTLKEYLDSVKKIHTSNRHKKWSHLGSIKTLAGDAALTQIDLPSPSGPLRLLQLILLKENKAYIITAACLKNEFTQILPTFRKTFHSLQVKDDLYSAIEDEKKRQKIQLLYARAEKAVTLHGAFRTESKEWQAFQNTTIKDHADLGPYWQALIIANAQRHLQSLVGLNKLFLLKTALTEMELHTQPYSYSHEKIFFHSPWETLHFSKESL